jgi:hypothetical protein
MYHSHSLIESMASGSEAHLVILSIYCLAISQKEPRRVEGVHNKHGLVVLSNYESKGTSRIEKSLSGFEGRTLGGSLA